MNDDKIRTKLLMIFDWIGENHFLESIRKFGPQSMRKILEFLFRRGYFKWKSSLLMKNLLEMLWIMPLLIVIILWIYTRLVGLSRDKRKELIIKHLGKNGKGVLVDFQDIFPELKKGDISNLLQELRRSKKIDYEGSLRRGFLEASLKTIYNS